MSAYVFGENVIQTCQQVTSVVFSALLSQWTHQVVHLNTTRQTVPEVFPLEWAVKKKKKKKKSFSQAEFYGHKRMPQTSLHWQPSKSNTDKMAQADSALQVIHFHRGMKHWPSGTACLVTFSTGGGRCIVLIFNHCWVFIDCKQHSCFCHFEIESNCSPQRNQSIQVQLLSLEEMRMGLSVHHYVPVPSSQPLTLLC